MKALVARSPIGLFAFGEGGELIYYTLWTKGNTIDRFLSKELDKEFISALAGYTLIEPAGAYELLRKNFREYAKSLAGMSDAELNEFLSSFFIAWSRQRLLGAINRDRLLVQSIRSLDDLARAMNVFLERLYEWYSLHYPEMKNANIIGLITKYKRRENMPGFRNSVGVDLTEEDEKALVEFAITIENLENQKKSMEKYISLAMEEIAPNFSSLVDPLLAGRLLAAAGSLEKLARMPASTIQLLGAEKALFRHLHSKGKSPKYGIIYNSPLIQNAPYEQKGKAARLLASKLMMAARIDYYSGRFEEKLKKELHEELRRLSL